MKLRVKMAAYPGAGENTYNRGKEAFLRLIEQEKVEFVADRPDLLFFLSGGSERPAINVVEEGGFYPLIASQESNAYAAATEVKAYLNQKHIRSVLFDYGESRTFVQNLYDVKKGLHNLQGQRLGLIGEVSEWLVASDIEPPLLQTKLGIHRENIPWKDLASFQNMAVSDELMRTFSTGDPSQLQETAKVYTLLNNCIRDERLNAITVECFSLVRDYAVTSCLPLAKFNADGVPAGCEGDIVSITGMMVAKEVTGIVPWIANTVKVAEDRSLFAHCTIAPNFLTDYTITTHFETGKGTAIQGDFASDDITLFRFDNRLSKAFVTLGTILNRPNYAMACRTQVEVSLPLRSVQLLKENPLGNHHLILPGNHVEKIALTCDVLGMDVL